MPLHDWLRRAEPTDLAAVTSAQAAFRKRWARINPPWPCAFDGAMTDVEAIDYLHYEGLTFPECGVAEAALVCGEVLRRAAGLGWYLGYEDGTWYVAGDEWPAPVVCPIARIREIEYAGVPQYGRFVWFLCKAGLDLLPLASPNAAPQLRGLLNAHFDAGVIRQAEGALAELRAARK